MMILEASFRLSWKWSCRLVPLHNVSPVGLVYRGRCFSFSGTHLIFGPKLYRLGLYVFPLSHQKGSYFHLLSLFPAGKNQRLIFQYSLTYNRGNMKGQEGFIAFTKPLRFVGTQRKCSIWLLFWWPIQKFLWLSHWVFFHRVQHPSPLAGRGCGNGSFSRFHFKIGWGRPAARKIFWCFAWLI